MPRRSDARKSSEGWPRCLRQVRRRSIDATREKNVKSIGPQSHRSARTRLTSVAASSAAAAAASLPNSERTRK
jgi:hypothetical protein